MRTLTNKIQRATIGLLAAVVCCLPTAASAVLPGREGAATTAGQAGLSGAEGDTNLYAIVGGIINTVLGLVGVVLLLLMIYAGFLWMTAGGNSEQVGKAKTMLVRSVIGAIVVFSALSISIFIFDRILQATAG